MPVSKTGLRLEEVARGLYGWLLFHENPSEQRTRTHLLKISSAPGLPRLRAAWQCLGKHFSALLVSVLQAQC